MYYTIVSDIGREAFEARCKSFVEKGYVPVGGWEPVLVGNDYRYFQPMYWPHHMSENSQDVEIVETLQSWGGHQIGNG